MLSLMHACRRRGLSSSEVSDPENSSEETVPPLQNIVCWGGTYHLDCQCELFCFAVFVGFGVCFLAPLKVTFEKGIEKTMCS